MASRNTPSKSRQRTSYKSLISAIDFYGSRPEFSYKGKRSLSSGFGGLVTVIVFSLSCLCSVYILWIYFRRVSSETNIDKIHIRDPVGFNLTSQNLPFVFGLQGADGAQFIDESIYTAEVKYVKTNKKVINGELLVDTKEVLLDLIPCSEAKLDPAMFDNLSLKHLLCLKEFIQPTIHLEITGEWESPSFGFLQFYIRRCKGPHCKSDEEINRKLKVSYFAVFYVNYAILASNYTEPVYRYQASFFTPTSSDFTKEIGMRLTDNEVQTHNTILGYMPPKSISFTSADLFTTELVNVAVDEQPENLIYMRLRMGKMKTVTTRVYGTAFGSLADLGGIINLITFGAFLISRPVARLHLLLDFIRAYRPEEPAQSLSFTSSSQTARASSAGSSTPDSSSPINRHHESPYNPQLSRTQSRMQGKKSSTTRLVEWQSKVKAALLFNPFQQKTLKKQQAASTENPRLYQIKPKPPKRNRAVLLQPQKAVTYSEPPLTELLSLSVDAKSKTRILRQLKESRNKKISLCSIFAYAYLPFLVSKKSPVVQAINEAEKTVVKELDFMRFLKLISDIEKLKHLLLTPEQLILFDKVELDELVEIKRNAGNKDYEFVSNEIEEEAACEQRTNRNIKKALIYISNKQPEALSDVDRIMMYSLGFHLEDQDAAMLEHNV